MTHTPFLHPFVTQTHRGIYGIIRRDNQILVIRKASDASIVFDPTEVAEVKEFTIPELISQIKEYPENFKDIFAKIFIECYGGGSKIC